MVQLNKDLPSLVTIPLLVLIFIIDLSLPLGVAAGVPYILPVLTSYWIKNRKWTYAVTGVAIILIILGYFFSDPHSANWIVILNRSMAIFLVLVAAILIRSLFRNDAIIGKLNENLEQKVLDRTKALNKSLEELKQANERFELAVRGSTAGLWDWNIVTDEVFYAPRFKELLGYKDDEIENTFATFEEHLHPDDKAHMYKAIEAAIAGEKDYDVNYRLRCKNGNYKWFIARGEVLFNDEGVAHRMGGSITDISEQKEIESAFRSENIDLHTELGKQVAELKAVNDELQGFTYSVSHDLRAPLRAISGFSRILKEKYDGSLDEEAQRYLSIVIDNVKKMGRLIDDLLAYSRMGRQEKRISKVEMNTLAQEVFEELRLTEPERSVTFKLGHLPDIDGDHTMIKQVLANLIGNALKYTGKVKDAAIEMGSEVKEGKVVFHVKDNGVGFDMKYAGKLFDIFQRLHGEDEFEGTGVGLAIVQRIVHRHNGQVWADSQPGKGATFYFSLPAENIIQEYKTKRA